MGRFYKMPEKKELILDTDDFYKVATDFQLEGLLIEVRLEIGRRIENAMKGYKMKKGDK